MISYGLVLNGSLWVLVKRKWWKLTCNSWQNTLMLLVISFVLQRLISRFNSNSIRYGICESGSSTILWRQPELMRRSRNAKMEVIIRSLLWLSSKISKTLFNKFSRFFSSISFKYENNETLEYLTCNRIIVRDTWHEKMQGREKYCRRICWCITH